MKPVMRNGQWEIVRHPIYKSVCAVTVSYGGKPVSLRDWERLIPMWRKRSVRLLYAIAATMVAIGVMVAL